MDDTASMRMFLMTAVLSFQAGGMSVNPRFELILALENHFFSSCVALQYYERVKSQSMSTARNANLLQRFLSGENIFSTTTITRIVTCSRNRVLHVIEYYDVPLLRQLLSTDNPSDAHWLLFLDNSTVRAQELLSDINIPFNCLFLVVVETEEAMELTEVYRIHETLPLKTSAWGRWDRKRGLQAPLRNLSQRRNNLLGTAIVVLGLQKKSIFLNLTIDEEGEVKASGFAVEMFQELSLQLNFKAEYQWKNSTSYGRRSKNGSWTGLMGLLQTKAGDISLPPIVMDSDRVQAVDFTLPIATGRRLFYLHPHLEFGSSWSKYVAPFSHSTWLCVVSCILGISGVLSVTLSLSAPSQDFFIKEMLLMVWGCFCQQGVHNRYQITSCRLLIFVTLLTSVFLVAMYNGNFTSFLAVKKQMLPFTDLQGLLKDPAYSLGMNSEGSVYSTFKNGKGIMKKVYEKKILPFADKMPRNSEEGFKRVCTERYVYNAFEIRTFSELQRVPCAVAALPESSDLVFIGWILPKGSPYREAINCRILQMMQSGVHSKLDRQWFSNHHQTSDPPPRSVTLVDVRLPIALVVVGSLVGTALLAVESFVHFRQRTTRLYRLC